MFVTSERYLHQNVLKKIPDESYFLKICNRNFPFPYRKYADLFNSNSQ